MIRLPWSLLVIVLIMSVTPSASAQDAEVDKSRNVTRVFHKPYRGGTELAFSGRYVYAGQWDGHNDRGQNPRQGGIRIFDVSSKVPRQVGFLRCPGHDNDVAVVKPGLVALGYSANACHRAEGSAGVTLADVRDPRRPRPLGSVSIGTIGGGTHTITAFPGEDLVYVSPGGIPAIDVLVRIIDVSNPRKPEVVAEFLPNAHGSCHDISFHVRRNKMLGFCAGAGEVQVWDVSNPLEPEVIASIRNPLIEFPHYALASDDGKLLAINDEAAFVHECTTGDSPFGRMWFYDISDPSVPVLAGSFAPPRGAWPVGTIATWVDSWCTSHQFNFIPGTQSVVVPWVTGGFSMIDASDPAAPEETAYYRAEDSMTWSAHWYRGHVLLNDLTRGFEALEVSGRKR